MPEDILISIIVPTLNSEKVLEKALVSVRNQSIDQDKIEILVIDGGSTDRTREIAKKYNAIILENPEVLPEPAVRIGTVYAHGKYGVRMGSDEEYTSKDHLKNRLDLFKTEPKLKNIVTASWVTPKGKGVGEYYNSLSDPFSYFVYRMDSNDMLSSLLKLRHDVHSNGYVFYFTEKDIQPISDGGVMFDLEFVREKFPEEINKLEFVSSCFCKMIDITGCVGVIKGETIIHDCSPSFLNFCKKLKFRVINNVHHVEGSGFEARAVVNKTLNNRKFLYPLYCIFVVWPLWDAIFMAAKKRKVKILLHFIFNYYVFFQILWQYTRKLFKMPPRQSIYGK